MIKEPQGLVRWGVLDPTCREPGAQTRTGDLEPRLEPRRVIQPFAVSHNHSQLDRQRSGPVPSPSLGPSGAVQWQSRRSSCGLPTKSYLAVSKELSALFQVRGRWGRTSPQQPWPRGKPLGGSPLCGPRAIHKPPAQWEEPDATEDPGSSFLRYMQAAWPWASHFPSLVLGFLIPTMGETSPTQGC